MQVEAGVNQRNVARKGQRPPRDGPRRRNRRRFSNFGPISHSEERTASVGTYSRTGGTTGEGLNVTHHYKWDQGLEGKDVDWDQLRLGDGVDNLIAAKFLEIIKFMKVEWKYRSLKTLIVDYFTDQFAKFRHSVQEAALKAFPSCRK